MEYINRLPLVGGFVEMTKSKKGFATLLYIAVLIGGGVAGVEIELLLAAGVAILTYVGGQSHVDAKRDAALIHDRVETVLEVIDGDVGETKESELKIS